jgi:hypothetical protein
MVKPSIIFISTQDVISRESEMIKRLDSLNKLEIEVERVKENHQNESSQLRENIEKNLKLIEILRQEKLTIQFELNNSKKEYGIFRNKYEEDLAKRDEQVRGLEQKSLDDEINFHSLLKEKEVLISRLQSSHDKLKTIFFEISSTLSISGASDIPAEVKNSVSGLLNEQNFLKMELAQTREEAKYHQQRIDSFIEQLRSTFLPQNASNDLKLIAESLLNREKVFIF